MPEAPQWLISVQHYELSRRLGVEGAQREFLRQCRAPKRGDLPAAGVVHRLLHHGSAAIFQAASTSLPKLRSRCAHAAYAQGVKLWIMIDDDVETDESTLMRLLQLTEKVTEPRIAVLPCRLRGTDAERERVNVVLESELLHVVDGIACRRVARGGCGLMLVNRPALERLWARAAYWIDEDGFEKRALFQMILAAGGTWLNEDYSFCELARQCAVPIYAPVDGMSIHDGHQMNLSQLR